MENGKHTRGVGSPTDCRCSSCRSIALRGLALARAWADAALAPFRVEDAERVCPDGLTAREAHGVFTAALAAEGPAVRLLAARAESLGGAPREVTP
jgi:hypothetical protein